MQNQFAEVASQFFANVGPILAKQIPESENTFESYLVKTSAIMQHKSDSINEVRDVLSSLKLSKSQEYGEISFNVIKKCFCGLCEPVKHVFNLSIKTRVFPDKLKIVRVSPVYRAGDSSDLTNYRPISDFPCLFKIFERIMYNRLFSYVFQEKNL